MSFSGLLVVVVLVAACSLDDLVGALNAGSSQTDERAGTTVGASQVPSLAAAPPPPKRYVNSPPLTDDGEALEGSPLPAAGQAGVNTDAAILRDFQERINKYGEIHKDAAKGTAQPKESADPAKILSTQDALVTRIRAARSMAKQGDIFTAEIRGRFRRLLAPQLKGEDGRDAKALIKDDAPAPGSIPFHVNAKYPEGAPVPTVPASLLRRLPTLPRPLEYRIIGTHLLLLDTDAGIIVDYIPNAIAL